MSKERELLKELLDTITMMDDRQGLDPLTCDIEELLSKPEQEPVTCSLLSDQYIEDKSPSYDMTIHDNPDALAWARFFRETNPDCNVDDNTMFGWFANAMMAMHDHTRRNYAPPKREPLSDGDTADMWHANKRATHPDSYWAGVNDAQKAHGIVGEQHDNN